MRLRLPAREDSVPVARDFVSPLKGELDEVAYSNLLLLVSETVTNAIRHAGTAPDGEVELVVERQGDVVHVEVHDEGPGFAPEPAERSELTPGGWGLRLVDKVAAAWGTSREPRAHVWFDLPA